MKRMEIVVLGASSSHVFSDNLENPFIPHVLRSMKLGKGPAAMHLQRPSLLSKEWGGSSGLRLRDARLYEDSGGS